jgi:hypothetical protein
MAATSAPPRTTDELRRELEAEREGLAAAVESLRSDLGQAADVAARLRERLPLVAAVRSGSASSLRVGSAPRLD